MSERTIDSGPPIDTVNDLLKRSSCVPTTLMHKTLGLAIDLDVIANVVELMHELFGSVDLNGEFLARTALDESGKFVEFHYHTIGNLMGLAVNAQVALVGKGSVLGQISAVDLDSDIEPLRAVGNRHLGGVEVMRRQKG